MDKRLSAGCPRWADSKGETSSFMVLAGGLAVAAILGASTLGGVIISLAQQVGGGDGGGPGDDWNPSEFCVLVCEDPPDLPDPDTDPDVDPDSDSDRTPEEAQAELEELGPFELAMQLSDARRDGDVEEVERLTSLLLDGIENMTQAEADVYIEELGLKNMMLALAVHDGDLTHPSIISFLGRAGAMIDNTAGLNWSEAEVNLLANYLDFDPATTNNTGDLADMLYDHALTSVLEQPGAVELLINLIQDGDHVGDAAPQISKAVFDYFSENPDALLAEARVARSGNGSVLQDFLEVMGNEHPDVDLSALLDNVVSSQAADFDSFLDPELDNFARAIGQLAYQIGEVGTDGSYDPSGILKWGANKTPLAPFVEAYGVVETALAGYQGDDTYQNLSAEGKADRDRTLLAMAMAVVVDPSLAPEIQAVLEAETNGTDGGFDDWARDDQSSWSIVDDLATEIEDGQDGAQ